MVDFLDRRESILARLDAIFADLPAVVFAGRNREEVSGKRRPAIIMHDAAEEGQHLASNNAARKAQADMVVLSPQIYIMLGAPSALVGTYVNEFRVIVIAAIWTDATLKSLVGQQGDISFIGCGLETTQGETREARMEIKFEFKYPLIIDELLGAPTPTMPAS
jgi:hypothetical protein